MSFDLNDTRSLLRVANNTNETVRELHDITQKIDKQIALLEKMVEILKERRTDADY